MLRRKALMLGGVDRTFRYIAASQATHVGSPPLSIAVPAGTQSGDLLVFLGSSNDSAANWTAGTGWTSRLNDTTHNCSLAVQTRLHDGVTSSWTFSYTDNFDKYCGVLLAFRNAAYDTVGSVVSAATNTGPVASAITLSTDGSIVIAHFAAHSDNNTFTTPSGMTLAIQNTSTSVLINYEEFYKTGMAAGSSGTFQSNGTNGGNMDGVLIGIKPA